MKTIFSTAGADTVEAFDYWVDVARSNRLRDIESEWSSRELRRVYPKV